MTSAPNTTPTTEAAESAPAPRPRSRAKEVARRNSGIISSIAEPTALLRAWEVVHRREHEDGDPSLDVRGFERRLAHELEAIRAELLDGSYHPKPLARVDLPKPRGGTRVLRIPTVRDRVVERAVHDALTARLDPVFSPWSFAYRPGASHLDAARALGDLIAEGYPWIVRCDVRDCFDTLDRRILLRELWHRTHDRPVVQLVALLLARPSRTAGRYEHPRVGAPQGAPLSPLLANLYLHALDLALARKGMTAVRFADDLAIVASSRRDAHLVLRQVVRDAATIRLAIGEGKTYMTAVKDGFSFVGVEFPSDEFVDGGPVATGDRRVLYVSRQGSGIQVRQGQIRVVKASRVLLEVPVAQVGQIVTFGSVGISAGLRDQALLHEVDVLLCSRRGAYRGRLDGVRGRGVRLRRVQYRRADDRAFRLRMASAFVEGKILNQRALLLRYARRTSGAQATAAAGRLLSSARAAASASGLRQLRGIEGSASRTYFGVWKHLLPADVGFGGRNRRPPRDPANAVLSYTYTMLTGMCAAALEGAGLDHHVGFLHDDEDGRPSLALDLVEEFRPLVADTVTLECFRRRTLTPADFRSRDGGVLLVDEGRRRLLGAFEERMLTRFAHVPSGTRTTYRRALFLQARQIAALVRDATAVYTPVRWR